MKLFLTYFKNKRFSKRKSKFMLIAQLFLKNDGHRQQQTDGIVNNCWRRFVTKPRMYKRKKKTKTMSTSLDKKER